MKTLRSRGLALAAAFVLTTGGFCGSARGQEPLEPPAKPASPSEQSWYGPSTKAEKPSIARQKAVQRGEQRMARLDALRWYGFSNSRPVAACMPYTTMYSPAWAQPGGRPFGWYPSSRPVVIVTNSPIAPVYR